MELSLVVRPSAITWNLRVDPGDGYVIATVLSSVANGVVQAVKELGLKVPVIVRLAGTNAKIAKEILENSGVKIISASNLKDAAEKAVSIVLKETE